MALKQAQELQSQMSICRVKFVDKVFDGWRVKVLDKVFDGHELGK